MGFRRRRSRTHAENEARQSSQTAQNDPVWLPGGIEVRVAGVSFYPDAISAVQWAAPPGSPLVAVLVPEPDHAQDSHAVAVHLNGEHVGYLYRDVAIQVQRALMDFSSAHDGRLVSCPAELRIYAAVGPQVMLLLDPVPLGVTPQAFQHLPDLDATIQRLFPRLDEPVPVLTGVNMQARAALAAAEKVQVDIDADYDRSPEDEPRAERAFREVADQLASTRDPLVASAWLGIGRATRYQRDHRDEALHAFIEALHWERGNVDAWLELVDMASAAPHVPTLIDLLARVPFEIRPSVLDQLLTMSYGRDRLGKLSPATGENLRDGLLALAESQGDAGTVAYLAGDAGLTAEKAGDLDSAVRWWRRAIAAGSTNEKVADKLSIWLTKRHEYEEAEQVLRQALAREPQSPAVADRLRKRLTRCEQNLAG